MILLFLQATESMSDKHFWHSTTTKATAQDIWSIWIDVSNWKNWDIGLKDAHMEDAFTLGAKGTIISLEGRRSTFKVVAFEAGQSYTIKTKLPLGSLYVKRYLPPTEEGLVFTHEVWFRGFSGGLFAKIFGAKFRSLLPEVLTNIKNIAEV